MLGGAATRLGLAYRARRYRKRLDPHEILWMRGELRPGDLAVDVGAYKGGYTYNMRREVGAAGAVLAFEPQPELAAYLRACVRAFDWSNVMVVERGLSATRGRRPLLRPTNDPSPAASLVGASLPPGARSRDVEVDTLDHALASLGAARPVRLLKCDVEGHELDVFRGAHATLVEQRPRILVECEVRHLSDGRVEDVFAHLEALGYRGFFFWRGERHAVGRFDAEVHQVEGRRPYANNFVFVPVEAAP